jgi:hypothetical protein
MAKIEGCVAKMRKTVAKSANLLAKKKMYHDIAERSGSRPGGSVRLTCLWAVSRSVTVTVTGMVQGFSGCSSFMAPVGLARWSRFPSPANHENAAACHCSHPARDKKLCTVFHRDLTKD